MRINRGRRGLNSALVTLILAASATAAQADPITIPGYTVADLGAGTPTFSNDANGNGVLNAPNGQVYAFPQTPNTVLTPGQGIMANFPLPDAAPVHDPWTYGNPASAFAYVQNAVMNANGVVAAVEDYGVNGNWSQSLAYFSQLGTTGAWTPPVGIWTGNEKISEPPYQNLIVGLNNLNQILGSIGVDPLYVYGGRTDPTLYNINTHTLTDLSTLLYSSGETGYADFAAVALSGDGRILLSADLTRTARPNSTTLLLTPIGVSPYPLEVPAPEPGGIAVMLLAIAGFAAHRLRESRRTS